MEKQVFTLNIIILIVFNAQLKDKNEQNDLDFSKYHKVK